MKEKFKFMLLAMMLLLLVACGNADSKPDLDGGTTPPPTLVDDPPVDLEGWESIDKEINEQIKVLGSMSVNNKNGIVYNDTYSLNKFNTYKKIVYNTKSFENKIPDLEIEKLEDLCLRVGEDSHIVFESNVEEIKFYKIANFGDMYFVDNPKEPREYLITIPKGDLNHFWNHKNIYVMDGNHGSTLKIDSNYTSFHDKGKIYLGLYVSKNGKEFSTDKVFIDGDVSGKTKVHFIFNKEQAEGLDKKAKYHGEEGFVIKVIGTAKNGAEAFKIQDTIPVGSGVLEWKYYKKEGEKDSNIWKLENKQ